MRSSLTLALSLSAALAALAALAAGCTTTATPRSAEVARPGHLTGEVALPFTYAPASTRGQGTNRATGQVEPVHVEGSSGAVLHAPKPLLAAAPIWFEGALRFGVFAPCEVGPVLGLFRQGGELRCGLIQQPAGAPLSMAVSGAAAIQPFFDEPAWFRLGVDLSRRWGPLHISVGGYASHGSNVHHLTGVPEGYTEELDRHLQPAVRARLHGWRISAPVGVTMEPDRGLGITWGVVPFVSVGETAEDLECQQCAEITLDDFEVPWGIAFTISARFASQDEIF